MIWLLVGIGALFSLVVLVGAPYVPTHPRDIELALTKLYPVTKDDLVVDLGSGDGLVLRSAARRGARALGFEVNIILVGLSWLLARRYRKLISHRLENFRLSRLPEETSLIYVFSTIRHIAGVTRYLEKEATRLKKPLYVISYGFELPGYQAKNKLKAHRLYQVSPLQNKKVNL